MKKQKPIIILEKEPKLTLFKARSRSKNGYEYKESTLFATRITSQAQVFKTNHYRNFGSLNISDHVTFSTIAEHPIWSKLEKRIDTSFANSLFTHFYIPTSQERPYSPSIRLKLKLVQTLEKLTPQELEMRLMFDMAIRRYLDIPMTYNSCNISSMGLNCTGLEAQLEEACFTNVLLQVKPYIPKKHECRDYIEEWFSQYVNKQRLKNYPRMTKTLKSIVYHLKMNHPVLIRYACNTFPLEKWFAETPEPTTTQEKAVAISELSIRAFTFLSWFESDSVRTLFWIWKDTEQQLRSLELQAELYEMHMPDAYATPKTLTLV